MPSSPTLCLPQCSSVLHSKTVYRCCKYFGGEYEYIRFLPSILFEYFWGFIYSEPTAWLGIRSEAPPPLKLEAFNIHFCTKDYSKVKDLNKTIKSKICAFVLLNWPNSSVTVRT